MLQSHAIERLEDAMRRKAVMLQSHAIERPEDAMKARGLHWSELRIAVT
jgi:hypothetical protein